MTRMDAITKLPATQAFLFARFRRLRNLQKR